MKSKYKSKFRIHQTMGQKSFRKNEVKALNTYLTNISRTVYIPTNIGSTVYIYILNI